MLTNKFQWGHAQTTYYNNLTSLEKNKMHMQQNPMKEREKRNLRDFLTLKFLKFQSKKIKNKLNLDRMRNVKNF